MMRTVPLPRSPTCSMALKGQTLTQRIQPMHFSGSCWAVSGSFSISLRASSTPALPAAAIACAIDSRTSLAPCEAPAKKTPCTAVCTGPSLGCSSIKKPSSLSDSLS